MSVRSFDAMPLGSSTFMTVGEADPKIWGHPLILEAMYRGTKPAEMMRQHYNRGTSMFFQERHEAALYDFQYFDFLVQRLGCTPKWIKSQKPEAIGDDAQHIANGYLNYASTLMRLGKPAEAIPNLTTSWEYHPGHVNVAINLGILSEEVAKDMQQARRWYEDELKFHPDNTKARQRLDSLPKVSAEPKTKYIPEPVRRLIKYLRS